VSESHGLECLGKIDQQLSKCECGEPTESDCQILAGVHRLNPGSRSAQIVDA